MNGVEASLDEARTLAALVDERPPAARVALCPPATLIARMADLLAGSGILVGGQDCSEEARGAFTGDVSADMLVDAGARLVILGHSERREHHGETDAVVAAKVARAVAAGLEPIVCVGETLEARRAGKAIAVVDGQIRASLPEILVGHPFAVAYEPLWAIGSGLVPDLSEIEAVHGALRQALAAMFGPDGKDAPILYGGSVKGDNAQAILKGHEVGGALVGGASLKAATFAEIVRAI
ncbi:MAG: triose-phosphate isomerase [Pseudomonadota bacterium]|nr:triose-phosphate isomerase [Pseudomonadota bacterium]